MLRSALLILSGNAVTSLMLLARNLLVARLIPVADYGVAATFAIAMAVVEMGSQLGLQQQIVQARNGEDPRFQAALQGFQVLRGVIGGIVLFALAGPIAAFLNVPETTWAYRLMALVPVFNAFTHFDIHRLNRTMVFWPAILSGAVPAFLALLVVWPLAMFYGDYTVMLYSILLRAAMIAVTSHLVARRPYRLVLDRAVMGNSLRFGWPLLINGMLLFAVFQGDKLIVGRELGMEVLAIFAMGFTLTLTPTLVMAKSAQNFFLPQLSAVDRDTPEGQARFQYLSMVTMQISLLNAVILVVVFALFGAPVVHLLLGVKYAALPPLLVALAILQGLRVAKAGGGVVALSCGHTSNAMQANLMRVATLPIIWYAVVQGATLPVVVLIGILGETAGYALSLYLVRRNPGVALGQMLGPVLMSVALMVAAALGDAVSGDVLQGQGWIQPLALIVLLGLTVLTMKDLRRYITRRRKNR
ncbi:oligosaccharide flippase family protein [Puniceibacterium sediminis]|uniref:Membrane protein involved in the export of O-antigen and teichoic acid n=1 Tax=Puniceibacterium sediminis TaxID=1608407 RepID=A0A238YN52_9RHOB|nr:oligosaccharide flippase family protein [Puniceibacterium sediminis]SNR72043.1 Membrane protein involved in the export of O-antigen and teichoic acid [Puniceibacterium sediminis]